MPQQNLLAKMAKCWRKWLPADTCLIPGASHHAIRLSGPPPEEPAQAAAPAERVRKTSRRRRCRVQTPSAFNWHGEHCLPHEALARYFPQRLRAGIFATPTGSVRRAA